MSPAMMRSAVDLPQPEGPSSETNSPARTSRFNASRATVPRSNVLPTSCRATMGSPAGLSVAGEGVKGYALTGRLVYSAADCTACTANTTAGVGAQIALLHVLPVGRGNRAP